jgi:hypothetical protein
MAGAAVGMRVEDGLGDGQEIAFEAEVNIDLRRRPADL